MLVPVNAQAPASGRFVGTISGFSAETAELMVTPDGGEAIRVKIGPGTLVQRVAPGEKDLKKAEAVPPTTIAAGDRVFVTLTPGTQDARRIVVMSAADITKRQEADRQDWIERGVAGIVTAKSSDTITLRKRSMGGEVVTTVTIGPRTIFRRYAPDSVRFADAKPSGMAEISVGDQLRARGEKSGDGLKLAASEVVFGTFLTNAGTVTAVDSEARQVTVADLNTKAPLVIKISSDSQIKMMPAVPGMMGGFAETGGMMAPGGRPPGFSPGNPPDLSQMLERLPAAKLDDLKPGMKIVVSSTRGTHSGQITAITLLANAEMLIRMATASAPPGRNRSNGMNGTAAMGMGGMGGAMSGGLAGLELPGMIP